MSALCQDLWDYCRSRGRRRAVARGGTHDGLIPPEWFAVIPRQGSRRYTSIDRVRITMQEHESMSGSIVRIDPPRERGLRGGDA